MSVELPSSAKREDTFCAVVPEKHAFTLAGGVYTGIAAPANRSARSRRSSPRTRSRTKWEAFVKINYAYGDGADVINKLTDEYATEHNVQNEPIE